MDLKNKILIISVLMFIPSVLMSETILPDSLTGLKLWLKSDSLSQANGNQINTWNDSSGNGNDAVAVLAAPTKGEVTLNVSGGERTFSIAQFSASTLDLMRAPDILNDTTVNTGTIIALYRVDGNDEIARPLGFGSYVYDPGQSNMHWNLGNDPSLRFDGSNITSGYQQSHPLNEFLIRSSTKNGQDFAEWFNGEVALATTTAGSTLNVVDEFFLGDLRQDSGLINQDIAEVIVFDRVLSDTERQGVEEYLYQKYFTLNPVGSTIPEISTFLNILFASVILIITKKLRN